MALMAEGSQNTKQIDKVHHGAQRARLYADSYSGDLHPVKNGFAKRQSRFSIFKLKGAIPWNKIG